MSFKNFLIELNHLLRKQMFLTKDDEFGCCICHKNKNKDLVNHFNLK